MIPTYYVVIPNDAVHEDVCLYSSDVCLYSSDQKAIAYAKKLAEQGNIARVYKLTETHLFAPKNGETLAFDVCEVCGCPVGP
jgi:hypothetical protein